MLKSRVIHTLLALLLAATPALARMPRGTPIVTGGGTVLFTHVQIGGAGATLGVTSVPSANLMLSHTDQFGCYKSIGSAQWSQLLRFDNMPAGSVTFSTTDLQPIAAGCDTIAGDSLNPSNYWMAWNGKIYLTTNGGTSFTTTCYPNQYPNTQVNTQQTKSLDPTIAVDPANSNIVYMGTLTSSLQVTRDQGATCAAVSGLAAPGNMTNSNPLQKGGYLIAFDSSGGTLTGASCPSSITPCTKNIYVSVYGTGVYLSTNAGASWTLKNSTGMPTTHRTMKSGAGLLFMVDDTYAGGGYGGNAKKFDGTTWTTPSFTNSNALVAVAVDPLACSSAGSCHAAYIDIGGPSYSTLTVDGGTTWVRSGTITTTSADVPWVASVMNTLGNQLGGGLTFDNAGKAYSGGEGVFGFTPSTSGGAALTFVSKTAGIEEYETNTLLTTSTMSGILLTSGWDVGCMRLTAPFNTFPSTSGSCVQTVPQFWHSYSLDWVGSSPSTLVSLADNQQGYGGGTYASYSAISTNAGVSWTSINPPPGVVSGGYKGGCIAATSSTNFLWLPTDGSGGSVAPYYTLNGGTTWTQISVAGVTQGWGFVFYGAGGSGQCTSDKVNASTFYIYNWNDGSGFDTIIKCTGGGATCIKGATAISTNGSRQYNPHLKAVPGQAGYLFLSTGTVTVGIQTASALYWSSDGGATVNTISQFSTVSGFGFGANAPGHTFPVIVAVGYYNSVYGIWQCIDWDTTKTWQKIGDYPMNMPLYITDVDGDKVVYNVFYYGTNSGVFCSSPSTAYCNGGT